ncbi:MAG: hypothetical protein M3P93_13805 [Actinomycetota bacterium]|nr:hypothetical protein [Actinomycetota bacterium]
MTGADGPVAMLAREAGSLVERLRLWTPQRFAAAVVPGRSRGDVVHHLAQALADLEGAAPVRLPRLDSDLALPDQLAVTADDLVRSGPPDDVARSTTAHVLLHRRELLGDEVPPGLAHALGLDDVLAAGRAGCELPPGP